MLFPFFLFLKANMRKREGNGQKKLVIVGDAPLYQKMDDLKETTPNSFGTWG